MFRLDAECAHNLALTFLERFSPCFLRILFGPKPEGFGVRVWDIDFPNPVGLAAGMDKDARCLPAWEALGFGFVEVGTVTAVPQSGNPRPRVFRLPQRRALINRMGFNNCGAEAMGMRLRALRARGRWPRIPVGVNIGKSKVTPLENAADDYRFSARILREFADFFVINVSSPNTPGLRELQEVVRLEGVVKAVQDEAGGTPVLIKLAPDLSDKGVLDIVNFAVSCGVAGFVATNTTVERPGFGNCGGEKGGLSGEPLRERANEVVKLIASACSLPIIGSGGVMDGRSAGEKISVGAKLLEIYTGFVYGGPAVIREVACSFKELA